MDLTKLELFVTAANTCNLTQAAQTLGYTQSGASHILNSLENELGGIALFQRGHHGLTLTAEGERLLPYAQEMIYWYHQMTQTAQLLSKAPVGLLRIAGFTSILTPWMPIILKAFQEQYPNVEFQTLQGNYLDIEQWVLSGQADCGFVRLPAHSSLSTTFLKEDPLLLVLPQDHPLAKQEEISLKDLQGEAFIRTTKGRFADVSSLMEQYQLTFSYPYIMHDYRSVLSLVEAGVGISIIPQMTLQLYSPKVCVRTLKEQPIRHIALATRNIKRISPLTKAFLETTQALFRQGLLQ